MPVEKEVYKLKIDEEFKRLIPPLSEKERKQLEANILKEGCRDAICVWHKTIIDGHNRYEICSKHQIPFSIKYMGIQNRAEVIVWICANQLGRRNIDTKTRQYLIGKRYEMEKIIGAHNAAGRNQHAEKEVRTNNLSEPTEYDSVSEQSWRTGEEANRTRVRLGEEYGVSHTTVQNYGQYAQAMDLLSDVVPELYEKLMSGKLKITQKDIIRLSQLPQTEIKHVVEEFEKNRTPRVDFSSTSAAYAI